MILISFASGLLFAYLGNWMARRRDAHRVLWTLLGFLFPPLLLILKLIHWTPEPKADADDVLKGEAGEDGPDVTLDVDVTNPNSSRNAPD